MIDADYAARRGLVAEVLRTDVGAGLPPARKRAFFRMVAKAQTVVDLPVWALDVIEQAEIEIAERFNPNHDEIGRFSSGDGVALLSDVQAAAEDWSSGASDGIRDAIRFATEKAQFGDTPQLLTVGAKLVKAIEDSPPTGDLLFRGIGFDTSFPEDKRAWASFERAFTVGSTVDMNLASWTEQSEFAIDFASNAWGTQGLNKEPDRQVIFQLETGAKALDISTVTNAIHAGGNDKYSEWLTAGRFEVVKASGNESYARGVQRYVLTLRQTGTLPLDKLLHTRAPIEGKVKFLDWLERYLGPGMVPPPGASKRAVRFNPNHLPPGPGGGQFAAGDTAAFPAIDGDVDEHLIDENRADLDAAFGSQHGHLSRQELETIGNFTQYPDFNAPLRLAKDGMLGGYPVSGATDVKVMDSLIAEGRIPKDMLTYNGEPSAFIYRGVGTPIQPEFHVGDVINDPGYASASIDPRVAAGFSSGVDHGTIFRIALEEGDHAFWIDGLGTHTNEDEIALARDQPYRVVGVHETTYLDFVGNSYTSEDSLRVVDLVLVHDRASKRSIATRFNPNHDELGKFASGDGGVAVAGDQRAGFDPSQPRDEHGQWADTGATGGVTDAEAKAHELSTPSGLSTYDEKANAAMEARAVKEGFGTVEQIAASMETYFAHATPEQIAAGAQWYENAHNLAVDLASFSGKTPDQIAGMMARLSPSREWTSNAFAVDQIVRTLTEDKPFVLSPELSALLHEPLPPGTYRPSELTPTQLAFVHPDFREGIMKASIEPVVQIAEAVKLFRGDETPNEVLTGSKVRSFFNNIIEPQDSRSVTVDFHMIDAARGGKPWLDTKGDPYHVSSYVSQATRSPVVKGSLPKGSGLYPYIAEAIFRGARAHNLTPNDYQAIVWLTLYDKGDHDFS